MKRKTLLSRLHDLLDDDHRNQRHSRDELKTLLKKLGKKHKQLRREVESAQGDHRTVLERKLVVLTEQRKKGVELLRNMSTSTPET